MLIRALSHTHFKEHSEALFFRLNANRDSLSDTFEHYQAERASEMGITKFLRHLSGNLNQSIIE